MDVPWVSLVKKALRGYPGGSECIPHPQMAAKVSQRKTPDPPEHTLGKDRGLTGDECISGSLGFLLPSPDADFLSFLTLLPMNPEIIFLAKSLINNNTEK